MRYICLLVFLFIYCQAHARDMPLVKKGPFDTVADTSLPDSVLQKPNLIDSKVENLQNGINSEYFLSDSLFEKNPVNRGAEKIEDSRQRIVAADDSIRRKIQNIIPDSLRNIVPDGAAGLPKAEIPELDTPSINSLNITEDLEGVENFKEIKEIQKLRDFEAVPKLDEISSATDQVNEIKSNLPKTENLTETVEGKAKNLKGIKALDDQKGALENNVPELSDLNDHEHYKEELTNKAKEKAVDHFAGHTQKLKEAQSKLADIKKKFPEGISSIKDLPKRRPNPMKGKPIHERLILGLTVQVHPAQTPNIDVSPLAAYKISERLSIGLGGNYRIMTKDDFKGITHEGAVYGYRGFAEFKLHKSIFAHAEYELMKTSIRDSLMIKTKENILERKWVDGLLVGIGKEYTIGGLVKGNMQLLYNFLHEPNSPYREKVMVRFGFSFQLTGRKTEIDKKNYKDKFSR